MFETKSKLNRAGRRAQVAGMRRADEAMSDYKFKTRVYAIRVAQIKARKLKAEKQRSASERRLKERKRIAELNGVSYKRVILLSKVGSKTMEYAIKK